VERDGDHGHVASVGLNGDPEAPFGKMTIAEVLEAMGRGETFHTDTSAVSTLGTTAVRRVKCAEMGCPVMTIESVPGAEPSLDDLPPCG
jgi:hypothetical protein